MNQFPEIIGTFHLRHVFLGRYQARFHVNLPAHPLTQFQVKVEQKLIFLLKEPVKLIRIVIKERTMLVSGYKRIPVHMPPVTMV